MKKKLIICSSVVITLLIAFLIINKITLLEKDIYITIDYNIPAKRNGNGGFIPEKLAPSKYLITKEGSAYYATSDFKKEKFIRKLSIRERIDIKNNGANQDIICKVLNIEKHENCTIVIK